MHDLRETIADVVEIARDAAVIGDGLALPSGCVGETDKCVVRVILARESVFGVVRER